MWTNTKGKSSLRWEYSNFPHSVCVTGKNFIILFWSLNVKKFGAIEYYSLKDYFI